MADLDNITQFSGITITSNQTTGTSNRNATLAIVNVTQAQRDLLQNVTPYVVNAVTVKVKNGTMIIILHQVYSSFLETVNGKTSQQI